MTRKKSFTWLSKGTKRNGSYVFILSGLSATHRRNQWFFAIIRVRRPWNDMRLKGPPLCATLFVQCATLFVQSLLSSREQCHVSHVVRSNCGEANEPVNSWTSLLESVTNLSCFNVLIYFSVNDKIARQMISKFGISIIGVFPSASVFVSYLHPVCHVLGSLESTLALLSGSFAWSVSGVAEEGVSLSSVHPLEDSSLGSPLSLPRPVAHYPLTENNLKLFFQTFIKNTSRKTTAFWVQETFTISSLKLMIHGRWGLPVNFQSLQLAGKVLQDLL